MRVCFYFSRKNHPKSRYSSSCSGYTLVEVLFASVISAIILLILLRVNSQVNKTYQVTREKTDAYQAARTAMEYLSRHLRQATLGTYLDYMDSSNRRIETFGSIEPSSYGRYSELHFVTGKSSQLGIDQSPTCAVFFQAPLGYSLDENLKFGRQLMNSIGFYLAEYELKPPVGFLGNDRTRKRFALMEYLQPSELLSIYSPQFQTGSKEKSNLSWFTRDLKSYSRPVAENILALIIWPHYPPAEDRSATQPKGVGSSSQIAPDFYYDSRVEKTVSLQTQSQGSLQIQTLHQIPPLITLGVIGIDEKSAQWIEDQKIEWSSLVPTSLFNSTQDIEEDVSDVLERCKKNRVNARFFRQTIAMSGARYGD